MEQGGRRLLMKNLKKLTLLHSNDMHGDFLAEQIDEKLVGGVSFLSGYVNMVRRQETYSMRLREICFVVPSLIQNIRVYTPLAL